MAALPEIKKKIQDVFSEKQAQVLFEFVDLCNELVKASDFVELKLVVKELAEAQKQSEVRLGRLETAMADLAEAQKRTEQRMEELAEAQRRTEQRVEELAEAQKRTEERVGGLERALQELAEAQRRTDQRMAELAEAQRRTEQRMEELAKAQRLADQRVAELAEAQRRTEQRMEELAEAQRRTEQRMEELAEAQKRTEEELQKLAAEHAETRRQLGGLAMTVGYTLENAAYKALPALLQQDHGLVVEGRLKKKHVPLGNGDYLEVNILGEGTLGTRKVKIVGESKAQLSRDDVDRFIKRKLGKLKEVFPEVFPVLVTHMTTSPEVEEYAKEKGIAVYYSYDF